MADKLFGPGDISRLPKFVQTQDSLEIQLNLLREVANRFGLYDAADYLRRK